LVIGAFGVSAVFASTGIKSAALSDAKVFFYGKEIHLKDPLVQIVQEGSSDVKLYMPMREILEYMQFEVNWDSKTNSVNLSMHDYSDQSSRNDILKQSDISTDEADSKAADIMQKTGNWGYIEPYLPLMSKEGIEKVVEIYNSKHVNPSEHKKASDYFRK